MAITLDGVLTTHTTGNKTHTFKFSTTSAKDGIVLVIANENTYLPLRTVQSVSSPNLVFNKRGGQSVHFAPGTSPPGVYSDMEIWAAYACAPLVEESITITLDDTTDNMSVIAFAVNSSAANPFDINASIPNFTTNTDITLAPTAPTYTTSGSDDFIFAVAMTPANVAIPTSGWTTLATEVNNGGGLFIRMGVFYKTAAAPESGTASLTSTSGYAIFGVDALVFGVGPACPVPPPPSTQVMVNVRIGASGASVATAPLNLTLPSISGTPDVGETLTADLGTWTGNP